MIQKVFILLIVGMFLWLNTPTALAVRGVGEACGASYPTDPAEPCEDIDNYACYPTVAGASSFTDHNICQRRIEAGNICNPSSGDTNKGCAKNLSCLASASDPKVYRCQPPPRPAQPAQPAQAPSAIQDVFGKIQPPQAITDFIGGDPTGARGISKFLSNLILLIYSAATVVLIFIILWGAFDWLSSGGDKEKVESARRKIMNAIIGIILFAVAFAVITVLGQFTGFKFFEGQGARIKYSTDNGYVIFECADGKSYSVKKGDPIYCP